MKLSIVLLLLIVSLCILQGASASKKKKNSNPLKGADPEDAVRTPEVEAFLITGEGSGAIGRQLKEWAGSFSTLYFDMASRLVYYQSAVNYETDIQYIVNRTLEFMSTERYDNKTIQKEFPQMKQFPFATQPIVFTYNVPNFLGYVVDRYSESLVMDPELLADIYMGRVTNWNDTRIRELNPTLAFKLPNMTITPVGYFGRETSTFFLSDAFRQLSSRFGKAFPEPFSDWPIGNPNVNPNLVTFFLGAGPLAYVQNTPGSIGYMPFYYFRTGGAGTGPYVLVKYNDEILLPNKTTVLSMFKDAKVAHTGRVEGFDYKNGTAGWPFTAVSYVHLVEDSPVAKTKCEKDRLMLKFFRWIQKDETAEIQSSSNGIYMLPENIRKEVVHRLERLVCWGEDQTLLAIEIIDDHDNAYFEALLAMAMALMAILAPPGLYIAFARNADGKFPNKVASVYTFIVVAGACTVYCSVIFFYLVPDENWVCQLRVWLTGVGYAVFLGAMFTRTFQYYRIFLMSKKSHIPDALRRGNLTKRAIIEILFSVGTVTVIQVAILIAWSVSDPLKAELSTIDDIERTASWVCKSDSVWLWIGLEVGFFMILLFYGLFVVFRTWDAKARFADSKWVLMAIYNMIIILAAMIPLFVILVIKDDNLYILATVAITFTVSTTLLAVYMPKAGSRIERMVQRMRGRSSETSHSKSTTAARSTTRTNNASSKSGSTEDS